MMQTLWQQFEQHASTDPDRIAVHDRGVDYAYGDVAARAQRFAGWLRETGIRRGDRIALLLPNCVEYVVCYLGILRAGAVVVALNPETTADELAYTLEHAEPPVVVVHRKAARALRDSLPSAASNDAGSPVRQVVVVGVDVDAFTETGCEALTMEQASRDPISDPPALSGTDLAQIIYTSGTTGRPKGVVLSHGNIIANCNSITAYLRLGRDDSVAVVLPFFYSYGNSLLFTHLAAGGKLVLASDFVFWNRVLDLIQQQEVTGFSGVPSTYALLLHKSDLRKRRFPSLRYLTCAGGALAPAHVAELREIVPAAQIFLMYGQTEATARLSTLLPEDLDRKPGSVGRGLDGVELRVLDQAADPVPPGEVGEIVARGENLMVGYWRDEAATRQVLRDEGLRTGDLAYADDDGFIYIVGRNSDMIKSGSYRISPQEIEDTIVELPDVAEAAVVGLHDPVWSERPVAFVVPSGDLTDEFESNVMDHCRGRLPRHKQPREVRIADSLPKTSSGKVQRARLRERFEEAEAPAVVGSG